MHSALEARLGGLAITEQWDTLLPKKIVLRRISKGKTFPGCTEEALRGLSQSVAGHLVLL